MRRKVDLYKVVPVLETRWHTHQLLFQLPDHKVVFIIFSRVSVSPPTPFAVSVELTEYSGCSRPTNSPHCFQGFIDGKHRLSRLIPTSESLLVGLDFFRAVAVISSGFSVSP